MGTEDGHILRRVENGRLMASRVFKVIGFDAIEMRYPS